MIMAEQTRYKERKLVLGCGNRGLRDNAGCLHHSGARAHYGEAWRGCERQGAAAAEERAVASTSSFSSFSFPSAAAAASTYQCLSLASYVTNLLTHPCGRPLGQTTGRGDVVNQNEKLVRSRHLSALQPAIMK